MSCSCSGINNGCNCKTCRGIRLNQFAQTNILTSDKQFVLADNTIVDYSTLSNSIIAQVPVAPTGPFLETENPLEQTVLGNVVFHGTVTASELITAPATLKVGSNKLEQAGAYIHQASEIDGSKGFLIRRDYDDTGSFPLTSEKLGIKEVIDLLNFTGSRFTFPASSQAEGSASPGVNAYQTDTEFFIYTPLVNLDLTARIEGFDGTEVSTISNFNSGPVQAVAITSITQSANAVVTAPGHTYITGDRVGINFVNGMTEINGIVTGNVIVSGDNITLSGLDSTLFTPYTSGGQAGGLLVTIPLDNLNRVNNAQKYFTDIEADQDFELDGFEFAPGIFGPWNRIIGQTVLAVEEIDGADTPLTTVRYVDPGTTEIDRTGSISEPYASITEAYADITDESASKPYELLLTPATHDGPITSRAYISLTAIGDNDNTAINGQLTIDTSGNHSITGIEIIGNIDINVSGLGASKIDIDDVHTTLSIYCIGDGAGNTVLDVRNSNIDNQISVVNAKAVYGACFIGGTWFMVGNAGTLDSDGNAASLIAGACRFAGDMVDIDGPLQTRAFFFADVIEGAMTLNDSLTSVTFDSGSHPQTLTLNGGAQRFLSSFASGTNFDPSFSPLSSDTVQDAIDELANAPGTPLLRSILLMASSTALTQQPGATDTPLQIEFGVAQALTEFDISATGAITCNVTGQYDFQLIFHTGRTGAAGNAEIYTRLLLNGVQMGESAYSRLDDDDIIIPLEFFAHLSLSATDVVTFEVLRDSTGINSGGLFQGNPTPLDWNSAETAMVLITQLRGEVIGADGDVNGPASSIDDEITTYSGTTGKLLKAASGITADSGNLRRTTANADLILDINGTGGVILGSGSLNSQFGVSKTAGDVEWGVGATLNSDAFVTFEHNGSVVAKVGYFGLQDHASFQEDATGKGVHIFPNGQISISELLDEPDFSAIIGSFTAPFGLPQLNTAAEASVTGRPRMIHYNSILEAIRYYNLLDNEFQSLMVSPNSSQVGEIPTFSISQGHRLVANSDVFALAGSIKRLTTNGDLTFEANGSGSVIVGNYNFRGPFVDLEAGEEMFFQQPIVIVFKTQAEIDLLAFTQGKLVYNADTGRLMHFADGVSLTDAVNVGTGDGDVSGPSSSSITEIATFADTTGKLLSENSDVSIVAGVMQRITNNQGFRINRSGSGVVQLGAGNVLGNFGVAETAGDVRFSIATDSPTDSMFLTFERNSTTHGIVGFDEVTSIFGLSTADGGGVFVDGGRTFIGIIPDTIPAGVACKIGSSGINTMMVPEIGQVVENILTGVQSMFHFNTTLDSLRYHDGVEFKTVAHTGVIAYFESGANSTDTSLTSVNTYQIMNHGGGLSLLEGDGWIVSPGDSNRMRWTGTGTWSGVCRSIFEIRNPSPVLTRNYDSRPFVNGVAAGQFWSMHNVSPNNDDPRIIEYETRFTISPGQEFDTRIKIKLGGAGSAQGARIFNASYDFRRFQ